MCASLVLLGFGGIEHNGSQLSIHLGHTLRHLFKFHDVLFEMYDPELDSALQICIYFVYMIYMFTLANKSQNNV